MKGDNILDNPDLREQLYLSSCILAELLRCGSGTVGIEQLVLAVGHRREVVEKMCTRLQHHGVLQPDATREGNWSLAREPSRLTLADLFSAVLA